MDRRSFFRSALQKTGQQAVKHLETKANQAAERWIRPPFAADELKLLLACTRCNACIEACPHQVVFPLSARLGAKVVGTPALDLLNKACHLCEDWPCVTACETDALQLPERLKAEDVDRQANEGADVRIATNTAVPGVASGAIPSPMPRLAVVHIETDTCLPYSGPECGACNGSCPVPGALTWEMTKPVIDQALCAGCGLCRDACIMDPVAIRLSTRKVPVPEVGADVGL